jgi:hypothetical protein
MKKLFTLLAFLSCFLGANAKVIVDAEVDYSTQTEVKMGGWSSESALARLSIQDGCLHFHSEEATDPSWDCQFHPIGGIEAEDGVTYTLHFKVKGSIEKNISVLGFGQTPYGQFAITTDWVEGTVDYVAKAGDNGKVDGSILIQCGDYVGDFDIAYLKITHEGKEEKPVQWENILKNGDASAAWANPDAQTIDNKYSGEGAEEVCAYSKEYGVNENNPHAAKIEDGVFVCRTQKVDPPLVWDEDGEQWGQKHSAGDPKPDNTWQNQFWINFPRPMKEGEQFKVTFKYKASEAARVTTQDHKAPGDYLGGGSYGDVNFTTEWQTYEKQVTAAAGVQSIAFNFGEDKQYEKDIVFYFDDITVSTMVLDKGLFAASSNAEAGIEYDYDNAVQFEGEDPMWSVTLGTKGKKDTWVKEVMISTVRGNDKAFKSATLKVTGTITGNEDDWLDYSEGANAKITLPAAGVWQITLNTEYKKISLAQIEGDEIVVKEPVDIVTNNTAIVVKGKAREDLKDDKNNEGVITVREDADDPAGENVGGEGHEGQTWDNQFFIKANRALVKGEVTVLKFKYKSSVEAKTTTQCHGETPGAYMHWSAIGDVNFTTELQDFEKEFTVPNEADGMWNIAFNMAEIKEACDYEITDVQWYLKGEGLAEGKTMENLIDETGAKNFFVKEGAGTTPYEFGTDPSGIINVKKDAVKADGAIYNLAGQRVSKDYKGIVVKNGKKYITK